MGWSKTSSTSEAAAPGTAFGSPRTLDSDSMLVVAVARRNEAALAELYRRHAGSIFCAALRVLSMRPLAEEIVRDVFLLLWRSPERFQPERGSLRAALLAQGHCTAIDLVRSENARRRREVGLRAVAAECVLDDQILDFVAGQTLREAVAVLREDEREAISLAYFGGHTCSEVAALLAVPEETISGRIRCGLVRLRVALVEEGIDPFATNTSVPRRAPWGPWRAGNDGRHNTAVKGLSVDQRDENGGGRRRSG